MQVYLNRGVQAAPRKVMQLVPPGLGIGAHHLVHLLCDVRGDSGGIFSQRFYMKHLGGERWRWQELVPALPLLLDRLSFSIHVFVPSKSF